MTYQRLAFWILFILFALVSSIELHRVPGLMGDEASEGQNVYELLDRKELTLIGERSYIGPLIDYIRVPFIAVFGYTALAMRLPIFFTSLATFALANSVLRRWFGEELGLFPLVIMTFSLPYLTHQRLAWAITLFPFFFFFFLLIWSAQRDWRYKWLLVGLAAGLGLHTHIMFAPTLVALVVSGLLLSAWRVYCFGPQRLASMLMVVVMLGVGFWAGFGTQFAVLQLFTDDQGDPVAVGELWTERLVDLPSLLPHILSGSSYVAHYTGVEFASWVATVVMWLVIFFALLGVVLTWRTIYIWLWLVGLTVHLLVLLYMIDRFSLRYFLLFVLGVYVLGGVGVGQLVIKTRVDYICPNMWYGLGFNAYMGVVGTFALFADGWKRC